MTTREQQIGIFHTDVELIVRSWDTWLTRVTGISAEAARHQPLAQLVPDIESRGLLRRFQRVLSDGVVEVLAPAFHGYLIRCAPQAPSRYFTAMQQWVTIAPLREGDLIVGTIVTVEDVTTRLEYERELAEQLASPDEATRLRAARAIEAESSSAHLLVGALGDTSWRVRQSAVSGLARHGGPEAVVALLKVLREEHRNPAVLNSALQALALADADIVAPLAECLHSPDADLRIYAALALGERRHPLAIAALLGALGDPNANVRYQTIESLGMLGAVEAVDALLPIAESGDFFLAFPAIDALTRIGDPRAGPRLAPLLEDELLRAPAAEALGRLGDETAVAPLVALLNKPHAPALAIVGALAALHDTYEQTYREGRSIADLVRQAIDATGARNVLDALGHAQPGELRALVVALGWLEGPAVQRTLVRLLGQPAVRKEVIEALVRHGSGVTEMLIEQLDADDLEIRQAATAALGRLGDARATPALIGALNHEPEQAAIAAGALGAIGDRRAFEALLGLVGHSSAAVRQAVVGALNSLGHPDLAERTLALLDDHNPHVRESAIKIAGYFGYDICVDALLARCDDADERVRRAALEHLPYLDDARVLPALAAALHNPAPSARAAAARALGQAEGGAVLPYLLAALEDSDAWVRYYAARSIGQHGYAEALGAIAGLAQADPAGHVRIAAIEALGQIGGADAIALLAPLADAADLDIARAALVALGAIDHPEALPPLEAALRASDISRRLAPIAALAQRSGAMAVEPLRRAAAGADTQATHAAIEALARIGGAEAIAALEALAADAERRDACVAALARLGEDRIETIAQGLAHPSAGVRSAVVEALAQMKLPRASEHVRAALDDHDATVRLTAARALHQLGSRLAERQLAAMARTDPDVAVRRAAHAALRR
jgi:HEAT repeat protein